MYANPDIPCLIGLTMIYKRVKVLSVCIILISKWNFMNDQFELAKTEDYINI